MICAGMPAMAQKSSRDKFSTEIIANNSTHIGRITKDSLLVITGSTYLFTVDTPEDQGLVSTKISAQQLLLQICSKDGSRHQYSITDKNGSTKNEGDIVSGDRLIVKSADGKHAKTYHIAVSPMAIGGQLGLEQDSITVNSKSDLTLYFTAGHVFGNFGGHRSDQQCKRHAFINSFNTAHKYCQQIARQPEPYDRS